MRLALEALAPRYTLGIVSNGNCYPEDFGLEVHIAFPVYPRDHGGIEKPDPRISASRWARPVDFIEQLAVKLREHILILI